MRALFLSAALLAFPIFAYSWEGKDLDDPAIQASAETAVQKLSPTRGGIQILGLASSTEEAGIGITSQVLDLKAAMTDLKAQQTDYGYAITLPSDVLFDFDKTDIKPEAANTLKTLAVVIRAKPNARVHILGHTDSKGSDSYNMELSKKRAESVIRWLVEKEALPSEQMKPMGYGETKPVAKNENADGSDNPEGRAKNRRVEVLIDERAKP